MIDPTKIAFDIDGVVADTMSLLIDIARLEFGIDSIKYQDITSYRLEDCIDIDLNTLGQIITKIIDGDYGVKLKPIKDAVRVVSRIEQISHSVLFVTARPYLGPIDKWLESVMPFDSKSIEIIATGSFEDKATILSSKHIQYFVEDRLETCFHIDQYGIQPVLFKQPWNRKRHPFIEVGNWKELESLIDFTQ